MPKYIGGIENTSGVSKKEESKEDAPPSSPRSDLPAEEFSSDVRERKLEHNYRKGERIEEAPKTSKWPSSEKPKR
jgi:hypothetical protein